MNRYDFYPGDFGRDTSDLTIVEDGIYRRLLDWYYSNERPIPEDRAVLIVRASTDEEKQKTHWVLSRFFTREEEKPIGLSMGSCWVWRSSRCDREIEKARVQIEANRRNGLMGGRPKKSECYHDAETQQKPNGKPNGLANGNPMGNPRGNPNETLPSPSPSPSPSPQEEEQLTLLNKRDYTSTSKINSEEITDKYLDIFNAVFRRTGRPVKTLRPTVEKRIKAGLEPWQIYAAPILVSRSSVNRGLFDRPNLNDILLRDGTRDVRGPNGNSPGINWIRDLILGIDMVELDEKTTKIAKHFGVFDDLKDKVKSYWSEDEN